MIGMRQGGLFKTCSATIVLIVLCVYTCYQKISLSPTTELSFDPYLQVLTGVMCEQSSLEISQEVNVIAATAARQCDINLEGSGLPSWRRPYFFNTTIERLPNAMICKSVLV